MRVPCELELAGEKVITSKVDDCLLLKPVRRTASLAEVLSNLAPLEEDFPKIADPPTEPEDIL